MKLIEMILSKPRIVEAEQKNLPPRVLCRGSWLTCSIDKINANKRVYEQAVWDKVMNDPEILEKMSNRAAFGEGEHPEDTQSDLMKTSHVVTGMHIEENKEGEKELYSDIDVLDTPAGQIINTLIEAGCAVGVSTRAEGDLEEAESDEHGKYQRVVPEAYDYRALDFTADPSTFGTAPRDVQMSVMGEAVAGSIAEKGRILKTEVSAILEGLKFDADEDNSKLQEAMKLLKEAKDCPENPGCACAGCGKCDEKKVDESVKVGTKVYAYKPTKAEGVDERRIGKVTKIEEGSVTIELEDGTTITTDTMTLVGDYLEVRLPEVDAGLLDQPAEDMPLPDDLGIENLDELPPEEEELDPELDPDNLEPDLNPDEEEDDPFKKGWLETIAKHPECHDDILECMDYYRLVDHLAKKFAEMQPVEQQKLQVLCKHKLLQEKVSASTSLREIRRLRIAEASAKAETDESIEILEGVELKMNEMQNQRILELGILRKKLADSKQDSKLVDNTAEIDALCTILESRTESLKELGTMLKTAKSVQEERIVKLQEQHQKEISEKIEEIKGQTNKKLVDKYIGLKLSHSGLKVHRNTRALLEKCTSVEDVDEVFDEIKEALRRDALRPESNKDERLHEDIEPTTAIPLRESIRNACKGVNQRG